MEILAKVSFELASLGDKGCTIDEVTTREAYTSCNGDYNFWHVSVKIPAAGFSFSTRTPKDLVIYCRIHCVQLSESQKVKFRQYLFICNTLVHRLE